jgi:hypothetical protein
MTCASGREVEMSDLVRLRLADLSGFDPVGLWVANKDEPEGFLVLFQDETTVLVHSGGSEDYPWWWTKAEEDGPTITMLHASTRDRVARWVAGRVGKDVGPSGPCWGAVANSYEGGGWALLGKLGHGLSIFMDPDRLPLAALPPLVPTGESVWNGVPALAALNPNDGRRLPDGSRWVDAAALAAVARHVADLRERAGGEHE